MFYLVWDNLSWPDSLGIEKGSLTDDIALPISVSFSKAQCLHNGWDPQESNKQKLEKKERTSGCQ